DARWQAHLQVTDLLTGDGHLEAEPLLRRNLHNRLAVCEELTDLYVPSGDEAIHGGTDQRLLTFYLKIGKLKPERRDVSLFESLSGLDLLPSHSVLALRQFEGPPQHFDSTLLHWQADFAQFLLGL